MTAACPGARENDGNDGVRAKYLHWDDLEKLKSETLES
jgi:hypothetical protein